MGSLASLHVLGSHRWKDASSGVSLRDEIIDVEENAPPSLFTDLSQS